MRRMQSVSVQTRSRAVYCVQVDLRLLRRSVGDGGGEVGWVGGPGLSDRQPVGAVG